MAIAFSSVVAPLVYSALLLIVLGTIIGLSRFYFVGTKQRTYGNINPGASTGPGWYTSANRAYINGIESLALFAPAVILHLVGQTAHLTLLSTLVWVYFAARLVYSLVYMTMGYVIWCSFVWLVSFAATIAAWVLLLV